MNNKLLLTLLSAGVFLAGSVSATVVFSDDFTDGTVDSWVSTSPGADNSGSGALSIVDGTSLGLTGNALSITTTADPSQQGPAVLLGSTYTLASTGDYISLSFKFVVDVSVSNTGFLRYALLDDPNDDIASLDSADGYFGQISTSATDRGRIAQTQDLYYVGTGGVDYAVKNLDGAGWQISADTAYNATLTITKTASGADATITFSASGTSLTATESELLGSAFTSFDTVAFGINASGATLLYDDISVDTNVPEPSTYAIFAGLLALGLVMMRRRRG